MRSEETLEPLIEGATRAALLGHLRQAAQWRTLSLLLPTLAHEVRAPLNALVINLELLKELERPGAADDPASGERRERSLGALTRALGTLRTNLDALIAAAREPEDEVAEFDLADETRQIAALLKPLGQVQRITIASDIADEKIPVTARRALCRHALLGLALNALKATPSGGELKLEAHRRNGSAVFGVVDTGPGMPAEVLEGVADLRLDSGVGLHIVHNIVASEGGALEIDSKGSAGTRAEVSLPLTRGGK